MGQLACLRQPWRSGRAMTPLIARRCYRNKIGSLGSRHGSRFMELIEWIWVNDLVLNTTEHHSMEKLGETINKSKNQDFNGCSDACGPFALYMYAKTSFKVQLLAHLTKISTTFGPWSLRQWSPLLVRLRSPLSTLSVAGRRKRLFRRSWKSSINCINISFTNLHSKCKLCDTKAWHGNGAPCKNCKNCPLDRHDFDKEDHRTEQGDFMWLH